MDYCNMNISGIDGDSLEYAALGCTTYAKTTSIVAVFVYGVEIGGGGGWKTGGLWWALIGCTSDCNTLCLEKGNPEATPKFLGHEILLHLENISVTYIHINKIEQLVPNSKIQKHKHT